MNVPADEGKATTATREPAARHVVDEVVVLFCGDSGDGMQLTGTQFTSTSAIVGNDVSTFPDYPSEIRAPAGSLAGVSAFQVHFSSTEVHTPGDRPDVLIAMNPAALRVNAARLVPGGLVIVNADAFTDANVAKAGYATNPLHDTELTTRYRVHAVPISTLTAGALESLTLDRKAKERCKNIFTLGLLYWLYDRPLETTLEWIDEKFRRMPVIAEANRLALKAGYHYGDTVELFATRYSVPRRPTTPGTYRMINGNEAAALGFVTAARLARKPLLYSSYPITPATDVLQELAKLKHLDVRTVQAEDEIAAMGAAIGAAFGGALSLTGTSGPGVCLKSEAIGLAISLEVPLVILNVQRAGPSTGLPTKTEQADLLQAFAGRHGESPLPILAAASPADCFDTAIEAFRIAVRYCTPVFVLSEAYLANAAEPWRIPDPAELEPIVVEHRTQAEGYLPYMRDPATLARPWVLPGTPGLEHRIGGLEKEDGSGNVSYDGDNHEHMCRLRAERVQRIAEVIPPVSPAGPPAGDLLVLSWGGSYGAAHSAVERCRQRDRSVAHVHLRHLNPFPSNLGAVLSRYRAVLIPELNLGQLAMLVRARYLIDAVSHPKLTGRPFTIAELEAKIEEMLA